MPFWLSRSFLLGQGKPQKALLVEGIEAVMGSIVIQLEEETQSGCWIVKDGRGKIATEIVPRIRVYELLRISEIFAGEAKNGYELS